MGRLRRWFLAGILTILPAYVTWWILYKVFHGVDSNVRPWIAKVAGVEIPGLGFLATILFVLIVGLFASNILGRTIIRRIEGSFARLPLFNKIYLSVKQIGEAVIGKRRQLFERAVLVEWPRPGCWVIGFVTGSHEGVLRVRTGLEVLNVFVPTTPNPTSGFLFLLPARDLVDLELPVEDALKLVISGGAVSPSSVGPRVPGESWNTANTASKSSRSVSPLS